MEIMRHRESNSPKVTHPVSGRVGSEAAFGHSHSTPCPCCPTLWVPSWQKRPALGLFEVLDTFDLSTLLALNPAAFSSSGSCTHPSSFFLLSSWLPLQLPFQKVTEALSPSVPVPQTKLISLTVLSLKQGIDLQCPSHLSRHVEPFFH